MTYRFEFEEPHTKGRRRVRAYDGDDCIMSGILLPARVYNMACVHENSGATWTEERMVKEMDLTKDDVRARQVKMREAIAQLEQLVNDPGITDHPHTDAALCQSL